MNHPTVTVGTVGAGYAARLHGSGYAKVSGVQVRLKTICDVNLELAEAVKQQFCYEQAVSDFEKNYLKITGEGTLEVLEWGTFDA